MAEDKWVVECYSFPNSKEYEKAKKEQETVAYIRSNTDLTNIKVVAKLYVSLIEKKTFDTMVGYTFLEELRGMLLMSNIVTEKSLPPIPVTTAVAKLSKESVANNRADRYKQLYETSDHRKRISIYANIILVIMVIVMLTMSIVTRKQVNSSAETELTNKYSSWKQQLEQKEQELNQREEQLNNLQDSGK